VQHDPDRVQPYPGDEAPSTSFRTLGAALLRHRRFVVSFVGGLLAACILYCLIAPSEYEASARIALRSSPATALNLDATTGANSGAFASEQTQLETLANVYRSDRLAWAVIADLSLYRAPGFAGRFERKFPGFRMDTPGPEAHAYLLDRFQKRLSVRTLPRTLILQIRFRSNDPALSAAVVNGLIRLYNQQETAARSKATEEASVLLTDQLNTLKSRVTAEDKRLVEFQQNHGLLDTPEILANGQPGEAQHNPALGEVDDLGRELVAATADRTLREAEYRAAMRGNPELVAGIGSTVASRECRLSKGTFTATPRASERPQTGGEPTQHGARAKLSASSRNSRAVAGCGQTNCRRRCTASEAVRGSLEDRG
jgi:uncharacterized protein involved in exopolysaccharide biosynthesis